MEDMRIQKRTESQLVNAVIKYLNAKGIFAIRMNVGLIKTDKGSYFRSGKRGMADILAIIPVKVMTIGEISRLLFKILWCECKRDKNSKQSFDQKIFENNVTSLGHKYLLIHSVDELIKEGL